MTRTKQKKATCIWCGKESEPYPIHVGCFEILEVYNEMLRIYQWKCPRSWIDFQILRTKRATALEKDKVTKESLDKAVKFDEQLRDMLDHDLWKEILPEHQRTKK